MEKMMNPERELTGDELDAVSGAVMYVGQCTPCHYSITLSPSSVPANAAAMAVWNDLLRQNGF
jgi:hypothetical protein